MAFFGADHCCFICCEFASLFVHMPDQLCNRSSCNLICFLLAFYFDFLQLCDIVCCAIHCHSEVQIQLSIFVGHTANQLLVVLPALAQTALKPVEGGGGQQRKRN